MLPASAYRGKPALILCCCIFLGTGCHATVRTFDQLIACTWPYTKCPAAADAGLDSEERLHIANTKPASGVVSPFASAQSSDSGQVRPVPPVVWQGKI